MRSITISLGAAVLAASLATTVPAQADQPVRSSEEFSISDVDACTGVPVEIDFRFEVAEHQHTGADVVVARGFMTDSLGGAGRTTEVEVTGPSTRHHFSRWIVRNPTTGTVHRMVVTSEFDPETGAESVTHEAVCVRGG